MIKNKALAQHKAHVALSQVKSVIHADEASMIAPFLYLIINIFHSMSVHSLILMVEPHLQPHLTLVATAAAMVYSFLRA